MFHSNFRFSVLGGIVALVAFVAVPTAYADTLIFTGGVGIINPGTFITEGNFTYDAFSGGLFNASDRGNPAPDMEGLASSGGGILHIVRNDVAGGVFTFDASDVMEFQFGTPQQVTFEGFKSGVLKGTDIFTTAATDGLFTSSASSNLSGVSIDELRVILPADTFPLSQFTGVDNVVLTRGTGNVAAPEPGSLAFLGMAALPLAGMIRRRKV